MSGPPRSVVLLALGAAVFIVNLDARAMAPLLPAIAADLGVTTARAGLLVSAYLLPYGLLQLAYGPLADRLGKLRVATAALLLFGVGTALSATGRSLATLALFRLVTGGAAAALFPLALAFIGDTVPYQRRQATIALLMASAGAAQAFGAGVGGVIGGLVSWRLVFPLIGGLALLAAGVLFGLRRQEAAAPAPAGEGPGGYRAVLRAPGFARLLGLVLVEGVLFFGGFTFLGGLLEAHFGMGPLPAGLVLSLTGVGQLATARALPAIVARVSERTLVYVGGGAMAGSFLLAALAGHVALVALASAALGGGFTLAHTTLQTRATEAFPRARATAIALFAFALFVGSGAGTSAYAWAIERWGYRVAFAAAGVLLVGFTCLAVRILRRPWARPQQAAAAAGPDAP